MGSFKNSIFAGLIKGRHPLYKPRRIPEVLKAEFFKTYLIICHGDE
jgi:hypothetical protein